jgi:hypothetical protein
MKSKMFGLGAFFISALVVFGTTSCVKEEPSPPWPTDYSEVFSKFITDPADDLRPYMPGSPPYIVSYSPVDVTKVSLGVQGDYLYIRIDYVGVTPANRVYIPDNPPVETQIVGEHTTNVCMDVDNNDETGGSGHLVGGVDVLFGVRFDYGRRINVYALYDILHDVEGNLSELEGEFGEGGPGHNYVIARHNVSKLGFFPRGVNVEVGFWSEAMSFDSSGKELYGHFAFDELTPTTWTIPM